MDQIISYQIFIKTIDKKPTIIIEVTGLENQREANEIAKDLQDVLGNFGNNERVH